VPAPRRRRHLDRATLVKQVRSRLQPLRAVLREAVSDFFFGDSLILAGYVAFVALFAAFPFLIFLLSLAGLAGETEAVGRSIELALELMPPEVAAVLRPAVEEVIRGASAGVLTVSILLSVWFASSGLESLRHAVNHAYKVPEPPHFLVGRLQSILLTVASAAVILIATVALVAWPVARDVVAWLSERTIFERNLYAIARYLLGIGLLFALTCTLYLVLPAIDLRLAEIVPGALFAVLAWTASAEAFSWYLRNFARYNLVYGSLAGVVLTLFFFYLSAALFIFGAVLNSAIRRYRLERARAAQSGDAAATEETVRLT
jgi:membrane protein